MQDAWAAIAQWQVGKTKNPFGRKTYSKFNREKYGTPAEKKDDGNQPRKGGPRGDGPSPSKKR